MPSGISRLFDRSFQRNCAPLLDTEGLLSWSRASPAPQDGLHGLGRFADRSSRQWVSLSLSCPYKLRYSRYLLKGIFWLYPCQSRIHGILV